MKTICAIILVLAIGSNALYAPAEPLVVPSVVYGVPEEPKPVVTPIKTEYSYTVVSPPAPVVQEVVAPAVHEEAKPAPLPFPFPYPFAHSLFPYFYNNPSAFVDYAPNYPAPLPVTTQLYQPPQIHAPFFVSPEEHINPLPFSYAYSFPHVAPQFVYGAPVYNFTVPAAISTVAGTAPLAPVVETPVVHEVQEVVVPHEPVVVNYDYEIPHAVEPVVVQEIPAPVVPQKIYGLPQLAPVVETPVVHEVQEVVVPQEPVVVNYDYQIPHAVEPVVVQEISHPIQPVVVQEIPAPVVPQTVYGLPQ